MRAMPSLGRARSCHAWFIEAVEERHTPFPRLETSLSGIGGWISQAPRSGVLLSSGAGVIHLTAPKAKQSYTSGHDLHWDTHVYAV